MLKSTEVCFRGPMLCVALGRSGHMLFEKMLSIACGMLI
jgi:hypothetical protein